jgi:GT2 family glycosyltransferase
MTFSCRTATILITTKDRVELFSRSLRSALEQQFPCEIVIVDDASSDDTSRVARELCPQAKIVRNDSAVGIIAARNQGFSHATGDVVFTLDDDALFSSPELVSDVMAEFDQPYVGSVTISLIDHTPAGEVNQRLPIEKPTDDYLCVPIFSGGANAIRREVFLQEGGYSGLVRQGEERGVALRMLARGMIVRVASRHHIDHFPQPRVGDRSNIIYWTARNFYQFGWSYVPMPQLVLFLIITTLRQIKNGFRRRLPLQPLAAMAAAVGDAWRTRRQRKPVNSSTFLAFQEMLDAKQLRRSQVTAILQKHGIQLADNGQMGSTHG